MFMNKKIKDVCTIAKKVFKRFKKKKYIWGNYTIDLTLEALLEIDLALNKKIYLPYVLKIMKKRKLTPESIISYKKQPFCHLNYKLYEITKNEKYIPPFVQESIKYKNEVTRSKEGAVTHRNNIPGRYLLIDMLQDYASRMAQTGKLTGDENFYKECIEQFTIYRKILRNPKTGLWHNGRGWLKNPLKLSPSGWSRGHGWLIRGMVESLLALPKNSTYFKKLQKYLIELANALIKVQDKNGMWHVLLDKSFEKTYPETSGTGMISFYLSKAIYHNFLSKKFLKNAKISFEGLKKYITKEGIILNASPGPGPLYSEQEYLKNNSLIEDGEGHSPAGVIFACAGQILLYRKFHT